ncbi:hypothetical protein GIB67_014471 [Kingdonia uniflora]|uniref:non-specific serine/threonine protein kinase n=1 Tax=Kingdonia uniflora TaxID=39325 RepID=A0A7J7LZ24_9MAGN|nr:hypothetical protein GIB67_014471 [Kingdonia uniflora]
MGVTERSNPPIQHTQHPYTKMEESSSPISSYVDHNDILVNLYPLGDKDPGAETIFQLLGNHRITEGRTVCPCVEVSTGTPYECIFIPKNELGGKMKDLHRHIQIMNHLSEHPNIARFKGAYEDTRDVYIVKELCARDDLYSRIADKNFFSEKMAAQFMKTIVEVVEYCHSMGVIHREITPESFLFSSFVEEATLKATNFRFSTFSKPRETFSDIVGSAYYIAPEMLSMNYGPEVDIWSAGVILYILLSRATLPQLRDESEEEIMKLNLEGKLDFKESWTEISESAKDLLGKMLERDPKKRITAYEVLCHPWMVDDNVAPDKPLDSAALSSSRSSSVIHDNLFVYMCPLGEKDPGIIFELQDNLRVSEERTIRRCVEVSTGTPYECISIPKDELWGKMEDLHREIEIMKLLSAHPNIARIKGAYEDQRAVYIVKELCAQGDFFNLFVEKDYYSEKKAALLIKTIAEVVEYYHSLGVTHRDINPDSFLFSNVDEEAPLKATSFRFFTFYKPDETFSDMVGMAYYIAPEMLSMDYGPEVDIWSAGVILYIILSGATLPQLRDETVEELLKQNLEGELDFKTDSWTAISESAKDLLVKMLERDPKKRITAYEVLCHPWIVDDNVAPDKPLGSDVLSSPRPSSVVNSDLLVYLHRLGDKDPGTEIIFQLQDNLRVSEERTVRRCVEVSTGAPYECISIPKDELWWKMEDLHREIQIMNHLSEHPNIARIKGAYEDQMAVYIVKELCTGSDFFDRIVEKGHYNEKKAAQLIKIIVEVVEYCHSLGVIHRDIRPENFLFSSANEEAPLKATGFSFSAFYKPGETFSNIVESAYYFAPEMLSMNHGPEVDIWSAGVILYILLSGVPPFWAETAEGIKEQVLEGELDFESEPWPEVSESAKDLLRKMLEKDPKKRMTAYEVLCHPWIVDDNVAPDKPLDSAVLSRLKKFSAMNKLKKMALQVIAEKLAEDEITGLKELFKMIDTDSSGTITFDELKDGLSRVGSDLSKPEIKALMDAADIDDSGTIDYIEFIAATLHLRKLKNKENLMSAFSCFDKDGSGYITIDDLQQACTDFGLTGDDVDEIIKEVDQDNDGQIDYKEFAAMMRKGNAGIWRRT